MRITKVTQNDFSKRVRRDLSFKIPSRKKFPKNFFLIRGKEGVKRTPSDSLELFLLVFFFKVFDEIVEDGSYATPHALKSFFDYKWEENVEKVKVQVMRHLDTNYSEVSLKHSLFVT